MTCIFKFTDIPFDGFSVKIAIGTGDTMTSIVAECVRRLLSILEQVNFAYLRHIAANSQFVVKATLQEIVEAKDDDPQRTFDVAMVGSSE